MMVDELVMRKTLLFRRPYTMSLFLRLPLWAVSHEDYGYIKTGAIPLYSFRIGTQHHLGHVEYPLHALTILYIVSRFRPQDVKVASRIGGTWLVHDGLILFLERTLPVTSLCLIVTPLIHCEFIHHRPMQKRPLIHDPIRVPRWPSLDPLSPCPCTWSLATWTRSAFPSTRTDP